MYNFPKKTLQLPRPKTQIWCRKKYSYCNAQDVAECCWQCCILSVFVVRIAWGCV